MDLSHLPIPLAVLYLGLAGTLVALLVASYHNNWSARVFFLLALRLAIGWHFLFEGLYKVHTHHVGETEANRPFSSQGYFSQADGPLGPMMRRQFGDVDAQIKSRVEPENLPPSLKDLDANRRLLWDGIATSTDKTFADFVPVGAQNEWKRFTAEFAEKYKLSEAEKRKIDGVQDPQEEQELAEVAALEKEAEERRLEAEGIRLRDVAGAATTGDAERKVAVPKRAREIEKRLAEIGTPGDLTVRALASYSRWTAGVEGRPSKLKYIGGSSDPALTAPQRRAYIAARQKDLDDLKKRAAADLGNGPNEQARMKELKALVSQAKSVLLADADSFLLDLKKSTLTTLVQGRINTQAPSPSEVVAANPAKFDTLFTPGDAGVKDGFDRLPVGVQDLWVNYTKTLKAAYPDDIADEVDQSFELGKVRLVNWYNGRDEFSGRNDREEAAKRRVELATEGLNAAKADGEKTRAKLELAAADAELKKFAPSPYISTAEKYHKAHARAAELQKQAGAAAGFERVRLYSLAAAEEQNAETAKQAVLKDLDTRYAALKDALKVAIPAKVADWPVAAKPAKGDGEKLDAMTMWMIVAVGAMLLAGLGTRIACGVGAIFLLMTYLTHPPFPWLPLPPNTEGNPLFVNKNVIELLALMVLMTFPTGRWMGLDALLHKLVFWKAPDPKVVV